MVDHNISGPRFLGVNAAVEIFKLAIQTPEMSVMTIMFGRHQDEHDQPPKNPFRDNMKVV